MRPSAGVRGALVPDILKGLRAAVATVVPFFLAGELGRPELAWVALGGWLGSLADPGGSRGRRAATMAVFAALGGGAVAAAANAVPVPWLAGAILVGVAFAASLARALGGTATTTGNIIVVAAAVAASTSNGADPAYDGLLFAAGASWALVLSSVVWPVWTHLPVRRAVADVFAALARHADALAQAAGAPDADWAALAREHQREVRVALEAARAMAVALRARRAGESRVGANLRALLGDAEQQFFALITLAEETEVAPPPARATSALETVAAAYRDIAVALASPSLRAVEPVAAAEPEGEQVVTHASGLVRAGLAARALAGDLDGEPDAPETSGPAGAVPPPRAPAWQAIRDALSPRSPVFRHAVRVAGTAAAAFSLGRILSPEHVGWVTVTALAVLQPFPGATITRAIERVVGTVLGSALAVAIMMTIHSPLVLAILMIPLSVAAVVTRPRSYRLFVVFLTPVFLLVATHWQADWSIALARIADAAAGGAIAFVAAALVAPSWERRRLPEALDAVHAALVHHAAITFDLLGGGARDAGAVVTARREVGVALDEAETSLERMLAEPRSVQLDTERAVFVVTAARRLSTSLTAAAQRAPLPAPEAVAVARAAVERALGLTAPTRSGASAGAVADPVLARIVRRAEILATASAPRPT